MPVHAKPNSGPQTGDKQLRPLARDRINPCFPALVEPTDSRLITQKMLSTFEVEGSS